LAAAKSAFKNIEYHTSEYIVGSVAIPSYGESDDAHVYLNSSGEIISYYFKDSQVSKIIDWKNYHTTKIMSGSKLHTAIIQICNAMAVATPDISIYDFRYPNAKSIKIIVDESAGGTDTFRFSIPSTYVLYKGNWSVAMIETSCCTVVGSATLDGVTIDSGAAGGSWRIINGSLSETQLTPDEYHTVSLYSDGDGTVYFALVLLYSEPQ
jgi:hypothetical protein